MTNGENVSREEAVIISEGLIVAFGRRFGETFVRLTEFMEKTGDEFEGTITQDDRKGDSRTRTFTVSTREGRRWRSFSSSSFDL